MKDGCYPLIARFLLDNENPTEFNALSLADFEQVFESKCLKDNASEEQKLRIVFNALEVSSCTLSEIDECLGRLDFSRISEECLLDIVGENPKLRKWRNLRQANI